MTMNDLFDLYTRDCIPTLAPRSQRDYLSIIEVLREHFGTMEPQDVKPRHVRDFLDVKEGKIHRNRMVMILSSVFYKAIGKWCIDDDMRNPCIKVARHPTAPRDRYITDAEFKTFYDMSPPQVQIAMDLAYLTGQRQADIVGLTWKQIEAIGLPRDKWGIVIRQGKTGKRLRIEISPAVETVLKRAKLMLPHWPREYVIRTKWGLRYTNDGFRALWQRCKRAYKEAGHGDGAERWTFHDIRAKCLSDHADIQDAYNLSGHIDIKMTRRTYDRGVRKVKPLK